MGTDIIGGDADRAARAKATLRLNLSVSDGNSHVYWKHDGKRFAAKGTGDAKPHDWATLCSSSTLKFRTGKTYQLSLTTNRPVRLREKSGRWRLIEVDMDGGELGPPLLASPAYAQRSDDHHPVTPVTPVAAALPAASTLTPAFEPGAPPPRTSPPSAATSSPSLRKASSGADVDAYLPMAGSAFSTGAFPAAEGPWAEPVSPSSPVAGGQGADAAGAAERGASGGFAPPVGVPEAVPADPHEVQWRPTPADDTRSVFTADLHCDWPRTPAGRRQYLLLECYVEEFGLVSCPLQIKVYSPTDKAALQSFPLRFVQYDFREDSSGTGDLYSLNFYRY